MIEAVIVLVVAVIGTACAIWLFILLPADMARKRNRSAVLWVLISLAGSPLLAILLLLAIGERPPGGPGL